MKRFLLPIFLLSLLFTLTINDFSSRASTRREVGNLVLDGIPEIPAKIKERSTQYQNIRSAGFVDWHPDGKGMLISTRFGEAAQLHAVNTPGADRRQITFFDEPVTSGWYQPRKHSTGFVFSMDVGGGEFFQYYWFDQASGRHTLLTDGKSKNESFLWSHNGDRAVFTSTKRNGKDFDLYLMEANKPETARLIKELDGQWYILDWSADDAHLLLRRFISANEGFLYTLNLSTGTIKEINSTNSAKKISYGSALFARRDGQAVLYVSDEDSEFQRLTFYNIEANRKDIITENLHWDVSQLEISDDDKWLAYTVNEGGIDRLYLASLAKIREPRRIKLPDGVVSNIKFDHSSHRLGFTLVAANTPGDAYSLDLKTDEVTRWTHSEAGGLNAEQFVAPELIQFPSFDQVDGKPRQIPAFYYKPKKSDGKPLPVIISIHGGPESQARAIFSATFQYWVNELGAAVLVPNVRGSSGYGKSYLLLDNGFQREDSVKDIGKLLDWISTRSELDAKRIAVIGGSYGGYMSLASMTHFNDRLKCGVDTVGISNFVTFLESTQEYRRDLRRPEYGDERDVKMREFLIAISPLTNAKKITKPLLVVQGLNDPRVPVGEAEQIVKTVRGNNGIAWYLLAKDEGHGFKKKSNQEFYLNSVSLFFEEYLLK